MNLTPKLLDHWLDSAESKSVGQKAEDAAESAGHRSGGRISDLLDTKKTDLTDSDYAHMRKVVGYVRRHLAQRPSGDTTETAWRYSLMNWCHDPSTQTTARLLSRALPRGELSPAPLKR